MHDYLDDLSSWRYLSLREISDLFYLRMTSDLWVTFIPPENGRHLDVEGEVGVDLAILVAHDALVEAGILRGRILRMRISKSVIGPYTWTACSYWLGPVDVNKY